MRSIDQSFSAEQQKPWHRPGLVVEAGNDPDVRFWGKAGLTAACIEVRKGPESELNLHMLPLPEAERAIASSSNARGAYDHEALRRKAQSSTADESAPTYVRLRPLAPAAKYVRVAHRTALR